VSRFGDRAYWLPFDSERPVWLAFKNPSGHAVELRIARERRSRLRSITSKRGAPPIRR
jgi:hypothetical protein